MSMKFWEKISCIWMQTEAELRDEEKDSSINAVLNEMCSQKNKVKGIFDELNDEDDEEDDDL